MEIDVKCRENGVITANGKKLKILTKILVDEGSMNYKKGSNQFYD